MVHKLLPIDFDIIRLCHNRSYSVTYHQPLFLLLDTFLDLMNNTDLDDINDVILLLLPLRPPARALVNLPQNNSRHYDGRQSTLIQRSISQHEREAREPRENYDLLRDSDGLVLRFSHGCKASRGIIGGRADDADLVFSGPGISRSHLAFTFDETTNMPIARDLSQHGISVTYFGEELKRYSGFDWPLVGPSIANGLLPVLSISNAVQFKVFVPQHDFSSPEYIEKVKKFRIGTTDAGDLLSSRPMLVEKVIGKGAFGEVAFVWNLRTRAEYVVKRPKKRSSIILETDLWVKEANIMKRLSHVSTPDARISI